MRLYNHWVYSFFKASCPRNVDNTNPSGLFRAIVSNDSILLKAYRPLYGTPTGLHSLLQLRSLVPESWYDVEQNITTLAVHPWPAAVCTKHLPHLSQGRSSSLPLQRRKTTACFKELELIALRRRRMSCVNTTWELRADMKTRACNSH